MISNHDNTLHFTIQDDGSASLSWVSYNSIGDILCIPESIKDHPITSVENSAITGANIKEIVFPKSISAFKSLAIHDMPELKRITFFGEISNAEEGFIVNCRNLSEFNFKVPQKRYSFENGVLFDNFNKTVLYVYMSEPFMLPKDAISLGTASFQRGHLGELIIPEGIHHIHEFAFKSATFEKLVLPRSLKTIDRFAFERCRGVGNLVFPKNLERISGSAFRRSDIESIVFSHGSSCILHNNAFAFCPNLKTAKLSNRVVCEGDYVFRDSPVTVQISPFATSYNWVKTHVENYTHIKSQMAHILNDTNANCNTPNNIGEIEMHK